MSSVSGTKSAGKELLGKCRLSFKNKRQEKATFSLCFYDGMGWDGEISSTILHLEGTGLNTKLSPLRTELTGQREPGCSVTLLSTELANPGTTHLDLLGEDKRITFSVTS